jgi:two-component system, LuxR family, response regulator FixJ
MSGNSQPQQIITALKQGANDFLLKPIVPSELLKVLHQAFDQLKASLNAEQPHIQTEQLTEKELEVAGLIKQGFSNKSIAEILNLKADTIKKDARRFMQNSNALTSLSFSNALNNPL